MTVDRYPDNWGEISRFTKEVYGWRCCRCYRSNVDLETHHVCYNVGLVVSEKLRLGGLPGKWAVGFWLFPLCVPCHNYYHEKSRWVLGGTWKAHNTLPAIWSLRLGYLFGKVLKPLLLLTRR